MKKIKLLISKIRKSAKQTPTKQSIMNQKSYSEEISIDQVPLPYGQSILSMTRYSTK